RARADAAFFARHTVAELEAAGDHWLGRQGRLVEPMWLPEGATHYQPIGWGDAFRPIAPAIAPPGTPEPTGFFPPGGPSNEAAFLYQLFVRELGTNNLPDCSNLCHESSGFALKQAIGVGKGTVQLEDFEAADVILVIGQNPGTNHPRMMTTLQAAARRGCRIVSVNPLPEVALERFRHPQHPEEELGRGTAIATLHLPGRGAARGGCGGGSAGGGGRRPCGGAARRSIMRSPPATPRAFRRSRRRWRRSPGTCWSRRAASPARPCSSWPSCWPERTGSSP